MISSYRRRALRSVFGRNQHTVPTGLIAEQPRHCGRMTSDSVGSMGSKVLVLGGNGMLGNAVVRKLHLEGMELLATARNPLLVRDAGVPFAQFAVGSSRLRSLLLGYGPGDYVVNCVGLIKHHMDDSSSGDRLEAIRVNAEFPYSLANSAELQGFQVVQIATDCVYSGKVGAYTEQSAHDALDVYGKTKSLGEVPSSQVLNLRCSIIGQESAGATSLVGWLLSQEQGATIRGYIDHRWNGVTTSAFAEIVAGLVSSGSDLAGVYHLVPANAMTKSDLSSSILSAFGRHDVTVMPFATGLPIDRTLATIHPELNSQLWRLGGYSEPPTIESMVRSLNPI